MTDEKMWEFFQKSLGYTDAEMADFRADPKSDRFLDAAKRMGKIQLVAEVVESQNCFSGHDVGHRIVMDGAGNLIPEQCPPRICLYLLTNLPALVCAAQELIFAGVDPAELFTKRCNCIDVGRSCGGFGRVVLELKTEPAPQRA